MISQHQTSLNMTLHFYVMTVYSNQTKDHQQSTSVNVHYNFAHPPKQPGAKGKKGIACLNTESMSKALFERRLLCSSDNDPNREQKVRNGQYFLPGKLKIFGAGNSAIPLILWDGREDYLRPFFVEERLAYDEGWHPYTRESPAGFFGLSFLYFM